MPVMLTSCPPTTSPLTREGVNAMFRSTARMVPSMLALPLSAAAVPVPMML